MSQSLALIFLSDVDKNDENIFADDTQIMASIKNEEDGEDMQNDLDAVYGWAILFQYMVLSKVLGCAEENHIKFKFNSGKFERFYDMSKIKR